MGISAVIDVSAGRFDQIVDRLVIHIRRADTRQLLPVRSCGIRRHKACPVKGVQRNDFKILDPDRIARSDGDALILRHAPFLPKLYGFLRPDKRYRNLLSAFIHSHHP